MLALWDSIFSYILFACVEWRATCSSYFELCDDGLQPLGSKCSRCRGRRPWEKCAFPSEGSAVSRSDSHHSRVNASQHGYQSPTYVKSISQRRDRLGHIKYLDAHFMNFTRGVDATKTRYAC